MPLIPPGKGRADDLGESIRPISEVALAHGCASGKAAGSIPGRALEVLLPSRELGEFGVDALDAGFWLPMLGVPVTSSGDLSASILDALFAVGDLGFGAFDVAGEAFDGFEKGGLLLAAMAAQLGEGAQLSELRLRRVQPVVGPVELLSAEDRASSA